MDMEVKKMWCPESATAKEGVTIVEESKPKEEDSPAIVNVPGNAGQFSREGTLCPEVDLRSRIVSVSGGVGELTSTRAVATYAESKEILECSELSLNIIGHPESKTFECGGKQLSPKKAKDKLDWVLEDLKKRITPKNRHNLNPIKNMAKQAREIVAKRVRSEKLQGAKEIVTDAAKVGGALLGAGAAAASIAMTAGASVPLAVPVILGAGAVVAGATAKASQTAASFGKDSAAGEISANGESGGTSKALAAASSFAEALVEGGQTLAETLGKK